MSFAVYRKEKGKLELPLLHPTEAKPIVNRQEAQECLESHQACAEDPNMVYIKEVPDYVAPALSDAEIQKQIDALQAQLKARLAAPTPAQ